ncbi:MAG: hypothetical protein JO102_00545, partial [Elusimicrobia bacterium]|nr:hypothetical protein [Elusimicrobiota bacterium]
MRAVKKVIERVTRWAIGVALFPVLWSLGHRLSEMAPLVAAEGVRSWWLYAAGALSYLVLERVTARPMWLYVVGHELTHAASGLLSGARIYSLRAGSHGGEVELSKSNGFI